MFNAAIAIVDAVKPKNEMEAAFAAQMVAVHLLTMKVSARAIKYEWDTKTVAAAAKLARTFTLQMEELRQMRGRKRTTRQNITVTRETSQHVHYHDHRGGGAESVRQPHATDVEGTGAAAEKPSLPSADKGGEVVPISSRSRKAGV